jgi:hypothetical protein
MRTERKAVMDTPDPALERAQKRAKELREFYGHVATYIVVNTLLVVIDVVDGSAGTSFLGLNWAYWPIFGWGIAIVVHAVSVFLPLARWEQRKVQQLYEKERERDIIHH